MKEENSLNNLYKVLTILAATLTVVAIFYASNLYKENKIIGSNASNIITVTGKSELMVKPDISNITLTIRESEKDAKEAEKKSSEKSNKLVIELKKLINEKDIKTLSYNSSPKYSYINNQVPKIEGYEVTQSITVKVRNTENVSKVLSLISANGVGEVSGPEYTLDEEDTDKYKAETRSKAIKNAKEKAEILADQLGVKLVRIVSFAEGSDYNYPVPMYTRSGAQSMKLDAEIAPTLPAGENKINSNVTITFEIR